jgi:hypothetical protein
MLNKVFISAPISVGWSTVDEFRCVLENGGLVNVRVWDRSSRYDQSEFDSSDAVVFILPKNKFEAAHSDLPIGLKSELSRAYATGKKVYIGYVTSEGRHKIYNADTNGSWIKGISGSANEIFKFLSIKKTWDKMVTNSTYGACSANKFELPKAQKVVAKTVPNPDYTDERLILLLS